MMPPQPQQQQQQQQQMPQLPPQIPFFIRQIVQQQQQQLAQQQAQQSQQVPLGPGPIMIRPAMVHQFPIPDQPQHNQPQQPVNGEIRIHLQRIPMQRDEEAIQVREIPVEVLQARPNVIRPIQAIRLQSVPEREQQQQSNFPPREAALLRESFGLTNEDLMNIQRLAQERIEQELRSLAQEDLSSNSSENDDDDSSDENVMNNMGQMPTNNQQQPEQPKTEEPKQMDAQAQSNEDDKSEVSKPNQMNEDDSDDDESQNDKDNTDPRILQVGRAAYGRSIITPVNIPVDMMQKEIPEESPSNEDRPHFVQPRSIREE